MKNLIEKAVKISANNKRAVKKSKNCGCYHCCRIFSAKDVDLSVTYDTNAFCPSCGVDAIIPDFVVPELNLEMLEAMYKRWFDKDSEVNKRVFLKTITKEYIDDIKNILREHGHKGKNRTILVLSALSVLLDRAMLEDDVNKYRFYEEEKPLVGLLPEYIDNSTWIAVKKYMMREIHEKDGKFTGMMECRGFSSSVIFDLAPKLAAKPNSEKKQEFANEILDALACVKK